ncbi:MAG: hypothetical protein NC132_04330 [Corallococcus sp.]|nr:hypothetical protein [Corallococcus sp.]MCM1359887.1 hypothetical protein [Corallococcus sp.]MCM1395321.1 hypothetical protein [Corallococcus sp.]
MCVFMPQSTAWTNTANGGDALAALFEMLGQHDKSFSQRTERKWITVTTVTKSNPVAATQKGGRIPLGRLYIIKLFSKFGLFRKHATVAVTVFAIEKPLGFSERL